MTHTDLINTEKVIMVEFFASWCPHCKRMMPIVEEVKEVVGGRAAVAQLDIDENQDAAAEADVQSVPTFIIYRDGKETNRISGEVSGDVLIEKIEKAINA